MSKFDYIIAGGGAAGLTLAFLLLEYNNSKKTILIIDKEAKSLNDRTWCFWEKEENLLENLVYKSWNKAIFNGSSAPQTFDILPYNYKMIRGIDFYEFMKTRLAQFPNLTWKTEEIKEINSDGTVVTRMGEYNGELVFNSTLQLNDFEIGEKYVQFLQHFKGYFIKTKEAHFTPEEFTYMDFRPEQKGECRFGYVLPFSETEALVEFTVFSENLLATEEYTAELENYIHQELAISDYKILEEEFGVIPMTDFPFPQQQGSKVFNIGICGGFSKPSTGYTFLRTQKILKQMAKNLTQNKSPLYKLPYQKSRFKSYDSTLLNVLKNNDYPAHKVFSDLFSKNGAKAVFKFLDEESTIKEELKIMASTPLFIFGKEFLRTLKS